MNVNQYSGITARGSFTTMADEYKEWLRSNPEQLDLTQSHDLCRASRTDCDSGCSRSVPKLVAKALTLCGVRQMSRANAKRTVAAVSDTTATPSRAVTVQPVQKSVGQLMIEREQLRRALAQQATAERSREQERERDRAARIDAETAAFLARHSDRLTTHELRVNAEACYRSAAATGTPAAVASIEKMVSGIPPKYWR